MKLLYRKYFLKGLLLVILLGCNRKSPFEGWIQYETFLSGEAAPYLEPLLRQQKSGFTFYQKGEKIRIEHPQEVVLVDYGRDSGYVLFLHDSSYIGFPLRGGEDDTLPALQVNTIDGERRSIAGYVCIPREASYTIQGRPYKLIFWEATQLRLSSPATKKMPLLPRGVYAQGIPLRLESTPPDQPITIIHQAINVGVQAVPDSIFAIPLYYRKVR